jgi:ABC-type molybdate transport system substrate-binding protein
MPFRSTTGVASNDQVRLRVVASMGAKAPLQQLFPIFERQSGHVIEARYASSHAIAEAVSCDGDFDILIVTEAGRAALDQRGVCARSSATFGTTLTSLAFPAHEPHPDLSRSGTLAELLSRARAISLSDPTRGGSSARYFLDLVDRLGLGALVRAKAIYTEPGEGAVPVHDGRADLGVAQASEVALTPGLVCLPLAAEDPRARSEYLLCLSGACHEQADGLGRFLLCAQTQEVRRANGLLC